MDNKENVENRLERYLGLNYDNIKDIHCTIVGIGALGSKTAKTLGKIGFNLKLIDRDLVESKNLDSQEYVESDIGELKSEAMVEKIKDMNDKKIQIESSVLDLNSNNIEREISETDVIIDSTDNLRTRLLLNDHAKREGIPLVIGMIGGAKGMTMTVNPSGPCLKCVLGEDPVSEGTCDELGISPGVAEVISALQVKQVTDIVRGKPVERLITVDLDKMDFDKLGISKRDNCSTCNEKYKELGRIREPRKLCGEKSVQIYPRVIDLKELGKINSNLKIYGDKMAVLEDENIKIAVYSSGKAIVRGVDSIEEARKKYDKLLGGR
ncbi:MAG: HesA/MoeB/ThiF family protein [archaeon]